MLALALLFIVYVPHSHGALDSCVPLRSSLTLHHLQQHHLRGTAASETDSSVTCCLLSPFDKTCTDADEGKIVVTNYATPPSLLRGPAIVSNDSSSTSTSGTVSVHNRHHTHPTMVLPSGVNHTLLLGDSAPIETIRLSPARPSQRVNGRGKYFQWSGQYDLSIYVPTSAPMQYAVRTELLVQWAAPRFGFCKVVQLVSSLGQSVYFSPQDCVKITNKISGQVSVYEYCGKYVRGSTTEIWFGVKRGTTLYDVALLTPSNSQHSFTIMVQNDCRLRVGVGPQPYYNTNGIIQYQVDPSTGKATLVGTLIAWLSSDYPSTQLNQNVPLPPQATSW